jgi:hypothetical protein
VSLASIFRHVVIAFFLLITFLAFLYTLLDIRPFALRHFVNFSYGMMAPYQGYERTNKGLIAEGQTSDGTWHQIDLAPYFPVLRGEERIRFFFMVIKYDTGVPYTEAAEKIAQMLLRLEHQKGNDYTALRLFWIEWEPSPAGYDALMHKEFFKKLLITVHV